MGKGIPPYPPQDLGQNEPDDETGARFSRSNSEGVEMSNASSYVSVFLKKLHLKLGKDEFDDETGAKLSRWRPCFFQLPQLVLRLRLVMQTQTPII